MASKSIFIAFTGPEIDQTEPVCKVEDGYECWNVKKFHLDGFIAAMQGCIPPVNDDVAQRNYKHESGTPQDFMSVSDKQYGAASWGLLLPSDVPDSVVNWTCPEF